MKASRWFAKLRDIDFIRDKETESSLFSFAKKTLDKRKYLVYNSMMFHGKILSLPCFLLSRMRRPYDQKEVT